MSDLEKAKQVIKENYRNGNCGIFNTRNLVGDPMTNIYYDNGLQIDICYRYSYFEVFGLSDEDFEELEKFYEELEEK
jgi:hypothetical protein